MLLWRKGRRSLTENLGFVGSIPTGSTKHRRRKWWTRTPDKRVISRFDSCSVYQISECGAVGARRFGELEVVGSIPTTQTIRVVGRADMQPPFKRRDPGSTPGRPTFGLLAQLAEQPPLKRKRVGSKPTQPTKCPCDAIGRHRLLKTSVLQVRFLSGVLAEMELWCALGSHKPSRTGFKSRLCYQMQTWCNWQHRGEGSLPIWFNPHRLIQMCWCGSTAEQLSCEQSVAGSTPVTSSRMRMWCSGKHPWLPTRRYEFESRLSLQIRRS